LWHQKLDEQKQKLHKTGYYDIFMFDETPLPNLHTFFTGTFRRRHQ
jgi:hypothetical protein